MIRRLIILLLIVGCEKKQYSSEPLPPVYLEGIKQGLDEWDLDFGDGGRWVYHEAKYDENTHKIYYEIRTLVDANRIAMNEYCSLIKDIHNEFAQNYRSSIRIYKQYDNGDQEFYSCKN